MLACAEPRKIKGEIETGTWITDAMLNVYCQLHDQGFAHSIECWENNKLVGGMYGLILGDIFFGESMFSRQKNASKMALHYLCTSIRPYLLDAQVYSEHLASLGAEEIDRAEFTRIIKSRLNESLHL
jgi:leucyl/phenylalanyl-tRNA--protein transferase